MIKLRRIRIAAFIAAVVSLSVAMLASASADAQTLANNSFESPVVSANTDSLRPTAASWTFLGQSGVRNNGAPNGSEGKQAAFFSAAPLSGNNNFGSVRQTVTLKPGTYYLRYLAAIKTPVGRPQPIQFYVNGAAQGGTLNPRYITDTTSGGFEAGWTQPFVVSAAGSYELRFDATNATNYGTVAAPLYAVAYLDAVTVVSVPAGFANAGFEAAGAWTLSNGATATAATDAPEGGKVLTMASAATGSQSLALPAGRYSLSLKLGKASAASGTLNVEVASNGAAAVTVATISATTAAEYRAYSTVGFAVPSGNHVFTLRALGSSFSVDAVVLNDAGPHAGNAGFETPVLAAPSSATAAGPTVANPTTAIWTFSGTGGLVQANAGSSNTSAPRTMAGKQYLALSGTGAAAQNLAFAGGTYVAVGQVAQGGIKVLVDGTQVGRLSASTLDFREVMSAPFVVAAGAHSLSLAVDTTYSPATPKLDEFRLLRVDVPPAVSITTPANGAVFQTGATVDITASASDPDGISNLAISRTPTGGVTTQLASSASSPLSTSWSNSSANGYTITASATDSTGATSTTSIDIRVNANPSAIVSVSPTGPVVTSTSAVTATVTVSAASDSDGTVTKIEFLQDAVVATTCTKTIPPAVAPFTCALSLPPRAAAYSLTVRVTDNHGGVTLTTPLTLRINTAPAVTLTAACVASCSAPGTANLTASPTDTDGTISKVEFYDGITLLTTKTASPWIYSHTGIAAAIHSYTAKAFDNYNASTTSTAQAVTVTAPVPAVALTAACTAPCNAPAAVTLTAVPANITGTVSKVEFFDGTTLLNTDTTSPYSFAAASVAAASHSYTAKVYVTGTTAAVATSLAQGVSVNALPTVLLTATCVAPCTVPATINFSATATDTDGTIGGVEFLNGTTVVATGTLAAGKYTASWNNVATGSYSFFARATDNRSAATTSTAVNVTVGSCGAPTAIWVAPLTGSVVNLVNSSSSSVAVSLVATATVATSCTAVSKVEFYSGTTLLGVGTAAAGQFLFSWANAAPGTYTLKARAYVGAVFTESAAISLVVNRPPYVYWTSDLTTLSPRAPANIALSVNASDADGSVASVEFLAGGQLVAVGAQQGLSFSATLANLAQGDYTMVARATDNRGAVSLSPAQTLSVMAPLLNLALGKIATQSSTQASNRADYAVDPLGTTSAITQTENYPWWEIDLGQGYNLSTIEITPTSGCCDLALDDLWIVASAAPIAPLSAEQLFLQQSFGDATNTSDTFAFAVSGASGMPIKINVGDPRSCCSANPPRYLRIWSRVAAVQLGFADIKVFGQAPTSNGASAGGWLKGATDGAVVSTGASINLVVEPMHSVIGNVTPAVTSVEFFNQDVSLGIVTIAPFSLTFLPSTGDHLLRARTLWADGASAWTNNLRLRVQAAGDAAIRIVTPLAGGSAYAGDEGIPGYFAVRGSWTPDPTATLEYLLECVPACANLAPWRAIKQFNGSSFVALVALADAALGPARITVRAMSQSGAVSQLVRDFTAATVHVNLSGPNLVDAAGQTMQGAIIGLSRAPAASDMKYLFGQVYYRDGQIAETPRVDCNPAGWFWNQCGNLLPSEAPEAVRTFYQGSAAVSVDRSSRFTQSPEISVNATQGEFGGDATNFNIWSSYNWSRTPRGWFRVLARGQLRVAGYRSFDSALGTSVILRFGSTAPLIAEPIGEFYEWQGDIRLRSIFRDFDDSRVPSPAGVRWLKNGVEFATAASCTGTIFFGAHTEHVFNCDQTWTQASPGDYLIQERVTDAQGLTSTSTGNTVHVQPWTASFDLPTSGLNIALGTSLTFGSTITATSGVSTSTLELLQDAVVVWINTGNGGTVTTTYSPPLGIHTYQLRAQNPGGFSATLSNLVTVRVVNGTRPTVAIAAPVTGAGYVTPAPIDLMINAASTGSAIQRVVIKADGNTIATLTTQPYSYRWTGASVGNHMLVAEVTDTNQLSAVSNSVAINVLATAPRPPTVNLVLPNGSQGFAATDVDNNLACLKIVATAPDADIVGAHLVLDGVDLFRSLLSSGVADVNYIICLPVGTALGTHTLAARVTTTTGQRYDSPLIQIRVREMQVTLTRPPLLGYLTTELPAYEGAALSFEATASSTGSSIVRVDFVESFYIGETLPALASAAASPWRASWISTLRSGNRRFAACAYDSDNVRTCRTASAWTQLLRSEDRNTLSLTGPTSAPSPLASYSYTVSAVMGTAGGSTLGITTVALFDAQTRVLLAQSSAAPFVFNLSFTQNRRLIAAMVDSTGAETLSDELSVTANQPPTAGIVSPVTGSEFAAGTTVPIIVNGADADGNISAVELWREGTGGSADTLIASVNSATLTYALTLPATTQAIRLYAYVTDNNGAKVKSAITTITSRADITDPRYFVWTNMNAALKAGNKAAALAWLTPTAQDNYSDTFDVIMPNMAAIVASYSTIVLVSDSSDLADYLVARTVSGTRLVFALRFILMDDGKWRLDEL